MNAREERGLVIAATQKLMQKGKVWIVPSQSGKGKYTVCPDPENPYCSCPDYEDHGGKCKHLYAVDIVMGRETSKDGIVTETKTFTFTEKKVYRQQDWPNYNLAQIEEKRRFEALLFDLCKCVENPPQNTCGRRRVHIADMLFAAVSKVYSTFSFRRFGTDLHEAFTKGYTSYKMNPIMACLFLEKEAMTAALKQLITISSLPLRAIETDFAVDSSGFSTSRFVKWIDEKYGTTKSGREWVKCHLACGVKTHVVTAVEILDKDAADGPQFKPLLNQTAKNFTIKEVMADKAYLSVENIEAVFNHGGTPYIAFKSNSTGGAGGLFEKAFHYYSMNREEFANHYGMRSNVESVFSMIKAKFRDHVRAKTPVAMTNEVLAKIVAHNICCLIMSQYELGIDPVFWDGKPAGQAAVAETVKMKPTELEAPAVPVTAIAMTKPEAQPLHRMEWVGA